MLDEALKLFAASPGGRKRHPDVSVVAKDLALVDFSLGEFLTSQYALWLDLRTTDDDRLHGSGRRIENASEGVTIQLTKTAEAAGALNISTSSWTPSLTLKRAGSSQLSINLLPKNPHSAIVCGQTECGKTVFILDLLEGPYRGFFRNIVVLCPTIEHNKTYQQCPWLWTDPEVYVLDPGERLHDYLRAFFLVFRGEPTLFIIEDCSATKDLTQKKDALSVSFLGPPRRHKRLCPHPEIQLRPEGLARADALGRTLPLQRSRLIRRVPARKWRYINMRTAGYINMNTR